MDEKELVRRIIDFGFIIKAQLHSDHTALLRSVMNILIMEAEDVLEELEAKKAGDVAPENDQRFSST